MPILRLVERSKRDKKSAKFDQKGQKKDDDLRKFLHKKSQKKNAIYTSLVVDVQRVTQFL
jgi:hypothetical protein